MGHGKIRIISGSLCLDFVDTLEIGAAEPIERLAIPMIWIDGSVQMGGLALLSGQSKRANPPQARALRDAIFCLCPTVTENKPIV